MSSDYHQFQNLEPIKPPQALTDQILRRVNEDLNPSAFFVFSKLLVVHFAVALFTLSVCPQLGFRLFGEGLGLMHYFMNLGYYGCMMACGAFFLGTSMAVAAMILKPEELKVLRKTRWFELGSLVLLSFMIFFAINREIALGIGISWLFGAFLSSLFVLEMSWRIKVFRVFASQS